MLQTHLNSLPSQVVCREGRGGEGRGGEGRGGEGRGGEGRGGEGRGGEGRGGEGRGGRHPNERCFNHSHPLLVHKGLVIITLVETALPCGGSVA